MENLSNKTGIDIPKGLKELKTLEVIHKDVIDKEQMLDYVLGKIGEKSWKK